MLYFLRFNAPKTRRRSLLKLVPRSGLSLAWSDCPFQGHLSRVTAPAPASSAPHRISQSSFGFELPPPSSDGGDQHSLPVALTPIRCFRCRLQSLLPSRASALRDHRSTEFATEKLASTRRLVPVAPRQSVFIQFRTGGSTFRVRFVLRGSLIPANLLEPPPLCP